MIPIRSCPLTIFEGPDGSGKTTAARAYAEQTGARYVHFGPLPYITWNLARMYVEAMLPAILGYQPVVFDRSWLSEVPYGTAFRNKQDRLGTVGRRLLERLALRCGAVVIKCLPEWSAVEACYLSRKAQEMLTSTDQLRLVYDLYTQMETALPGLQWDYMQHQAIRPTQLSALRTAYHRTDVQSAGNLQGTVLLVGDHAPPLCESDPFYQWPYASFACGSQSEWLTTQLIRVGMSEHSLLWVNTDQNVQAVFMDSSIEAVAALGDTAAARLQKLGIPATVLPHPQTLNAKPLLSFLERFV